MAKKKKEAATFDSAKFFDDFEDCIFDADSIVGTKRNIISVSPTFDLSTGGIPEGCLVSFTGPPKCGKTTLALWAAGKAQSDKYIDEDLFPEGRKVIYINGEYRVQDRNLSGIKSLNLDPSRFKLFQSSPGNILTAQKYYSAIQRAVNEIPGCIVVVDSFSIFSSEQEMNADIGYEDRGRSNKMLGELMRKIAAPLAINKCIIIGITHMYANTSGYGAASLEKTSQSLKYQEDIKLRFKKLEAWRTGTDEKSPQIGQKVEWSVDFAAILPPGGKTTSHIRYNTGIDEASELMELGTEFGLIEKGGAWYKFVFLGEDKAEQFQGQEKASIALSQNKDMFDELKKQVYEIAGIAL